MMRLRLLTLLFVGLAGVTVVAQESDGTDGSQAVTQSEDLDSTKRQIKKTTITLLRDQVATRDKTIGVLEDHLESHRDMIKQLEDELTQKDKEIARLEKLLKFQKSLTKFQEGQINKLREIGDEQRTQIEQLNELTGTQ